VHARLQSEKQGLTGQSVAMRQRTCCSCCGGVRQRVADARTGAELDQLSEEVAFLQVERTQLAAALQDAEEREKASFVVMDEWSDLTGL
jgi:hypothetical protein